MKRTRKFMLAVLAAVLVFSVGAVIFWSGDRRPSEDELHGAIGVAARDISDRSHEGVEGPEVATRWLDPDGEPLPFRTNEEVLDFLATAAIASTEEIGEGVTKPWRVLLEKDGLRMRAVFRYGDVQQERATVGGRSYVNFRDRYIHEKAAYELARLVGLDTVPPVVAREVEGKPGTLQVWIEKAMTEKGRKKDQAGPPSAIAWRRQVQTMKVFDALIFNIDRNESNILYDAGWNMWFIDHTRSFRPETDPPELGAIHSCDRRLWEKLQALGDDDIRACLKPYVKWDQIPGVLKRREKIVRHIQSLIKDRGEEAVLFGGS